MYLKCSSYWQKVSLKSELKTSFMCMRSWLLCTFCSVYWTYLLPAVSQCNPLPHTNIHWLPLYTKLMWAKNRRKISLLTNYRIFWNPQIRYKKSTKNHWVSKLSQKWLLKVKMGWNLTTTDLMSTNPSILVYAQWEFSIRTSLTLNFKWPVQKLQINSPFTLGDLPARLSQRIQKVLTGSYNSCQIITGISWFTVNRVRKILCTVQFNASSWHIWWE